MNKTYIFIGIQALLALTYSIMPLSAKPYMSFDLLIMLYVFWIMCYENIIGLSTAWCLGLLQDVLAGSRLGEHAFALTVVAYLTLKLAKRMRFFAYWQQALAVAALVLVNRLIIALLEGAQGHFNTIDVLFYPPAMSFLCWLLASYILNFREDAVLNAPLA